MKNRKKIIIRVILLCLFMLVGSIAVAVVRPMITPITYSNLVDKETLDSVAQELSETGVPEEKVALFKEQVEATNNFLGDYQSFKPGFTTVKGGAAPYDEVEAFNRFGRAMTGFEDINCRLAAWSLMQDLVDATPWEANQYEALDVYTGRLGFEKRILESYPYVNMKGEELLKYCRVMEGIPLNLPTSVGGSAKAVQKAWKERGVTFEDSKRSLISGFVYNIQSRSLEVQHAGVLIERENDLLFVEKWNHTMPYQATVFQNRKQLNNYLEDRFRKNFVFQVIVMENDQLLVK